MAKKSKKKPAGGSQEGRSEKASIATTDRPRHSETTKDNLLVLPPEPTAREIKFREACVDNTHKRGGPKLTAGRKERDTTTRNLLKEPDVPETIPEQAPEE